MTNEDFLQIESSQRQHNELILQQLRLEAAQRAVDYMVIKILEPKLSVDGDQYCFLYGPNLQEGIAGFGSTIHEAVLDFNKALIRPLAKKKITGYNGHI